VFAQAMDLYFAWFEKRTGLPPKIEGAEGKALKSILAYLSPLAAKKGGDPVASLAYVLHHWDELKPFYRDQPTLVGINKNLNEILSYFKQRGNRAGSAADEDSVRARFERRAAKRAELGSGEGGDGGNAS
jgi:hypothetical protein